MTSKHKTSNRFREERRTRLDTGAGMNLNLPKYKPETYGLFALILIFTVLSLIPLLQSGYFNDDVLNSQVRGIINLDNWSLLDFTTHYFKGWIANQGRFYPLAWYLYVVFYYIDSLFIYKVCILVFICIDIIVFSAFLKRLIPILILYSYPLSCCHYSFNLGAIPIQYSRSIFYCRSFFCIA